MIVFDKSFRIAVHAFNGSVSSTIHSLMHLFQMFQRNWFYTRTAFEIIHPYEYQEHHHLGIGLRMISGRLAMVSDHWSPRSNWKTEKRQISLIIRCPVLCFSLLSPPFHLSLLILFLSLIFCPVLIISHHEKAVKYQCIPTSLAC